MKQAQTVKTIIAAAVMAVMMFPLEAKAQVAYRLNKEHAAVQLRSNCLYDLLASPNVGVEIQTDLGLAFQLDYTGAWWNSYTRNRFWSNYIFQSELRYYTDRKRMDTPYFGHHFGAYAQLGTYDFEFGGKGRLCRDLDMTVGIGVSYGYSMAVSKSLNIDFTLGLGFLHSRYDYYQPNREGDGYSRIETRQLNFIGPTKLEVALVWNINAKNVFQNR